MLIILKRTFVFCVVNIYNIAPLQQDIQMYSFWLFLQRKLVFNKYIIKSRVPLRKWGHNHSLSKEYND